MSRITNDLAESIAKTMTAKQSQTIEELKSKQKQITLDYIMKGIPKEVKELFDKNSKYLNYNSGVRFWGNGCQGLYVNIGKHPTDGLNITPEPEFAKELVKLDNAIQKKQDALYELKQSIENALKAMRTFKRVRVDFPEAGEFLPPDGKSMLPAINLSSIRQQLKS
jgi:hypothetical protein